MMAYRQFRMRKSLRLSLVQDTRENGVKKVIKNMDSGFRFGEMGQCIKECGNLIRLTDGDD